MKIILASSSPVDIFDANTQISQDNQEYIQTTWLLFMTPTVDITGSNYTVSSETLENLRGDNGYLRIILKIGLQSSPVLYLSLLDDHDILRRMRSYLKVEPSEKSLTLEFELKVLDNLLLKFSGFNWTNLELPGESLLAIAENKTVSFEAALMLMKSSYEDVTVSGILAFNPHIDESATNVAKNNMKLLEDKIATDFEITSKDGTSVACHTAFLILYSPVLADEIKDLRSKKLDQKFKLDASGKTLRALLAYIYSRDLKFAEEDFQIAVELYQTAHQLKIWSLMSDVKALLIAKPMDHFNPSDALNLFNFLSKLKIEDSGDILQKLVHAVALNPLESIDDVSVDAYMAANPEFGKTWWMHSLRTIKENGPVKKRARLTE